MIDDVLGGIKQPSSPSSPSSPKLMLQDYKKFKHGKEVPQEAEIQYLKQHLLAQGLVHHKHVMHMPHALPRSDPNPANTTDFIMMAARAYSTKNTWYVAAAAAAEQKKALEKVRSHQRLLLLLPYIAIQAWLMWQRCFPRRVVSCRLAHHLLPLLQLLRLLPGQTAESFDMCCPAEGIVSGRERPHSAMQCLDGL